MTNYTAHTLIQKPEGLFVIAYEGKEPKQREQIIYGQQRLNMTDRWKEAHNKWLSTTKHFRVKQEDVECLKDLVNESILNSVIGTQKEVLHKSFNRILAEGINIEKIADGVWFAPSCCEDCDGTNYICRPSQWVTFATLKPVDKPIEESQSDAVEFAEWMIDGFIDGSIHRWSNERNVVIFNGPKGVKTNIKELYKIFLKIK